MRYDDKRAEHLERVSLESSRVDLSSPLVFLCGGEVDIRKPFLSIRSALIDHWHCKKFKYCDSLTLAEHFKDWINDSVYQDLVLFENDLASVSSLIVLILESPGALAELGLFVRSSHINEKLVVVVNDEHYNSLSFIKLGPLRHLERINSRGICAYPWDFSDLASSLPPVLDEICGDLVSCLDVLDKSEAFDAENKGHMAFLIFEVVRIYRALKLTEIELYLSKLAVSLSRDELKRLLFLLEKIQLVRSVRRGHQTYYHVLSETVRINFAGSFDERASRMAAMQFYALSDSEKQRIEVIKTAYTEPASVQTTGVQA